MKDSKCKKNCHQAPFLMGAHTHTHTHRKRESLDHDYTPVDSLPTEVGDDILLNELQQVLLKNMIVFNST